MNKRTIIIILFAGLLTGCNSGFKNDIIYPDKYIGQPESVWKRFMNKLITNHGFDEFNDSLILYKETSFDKKDVLGLLYKFNYYSHYKFGNLGSFSIAFVGDTSFRYFDGTFVSDKDGYLKKEQLDYLLDMVLNKYSNPDSMAIEKKPMSSFFVSKPSLFPNYGKKQSFNISTFDSVKYHKSIILYWYKENYKIEFTHSSLIEIEKNKKPCLIADDVALDYTSNTYQSEIYEIKDSIRDLLKPNEILRIDNLRPTQIEEIDPQFYNGYDKSLEMCYNGIGRLRLEEDRTIKSIRIEVEFNDGFDENIAKLNKVDIAFNPYLSISYKGGLVSGVYIEYPEGKYFNYLYSSQTPEGISIERLLQASEIKTNYKIVGIQLDNGIVLK